MGKVVRFFGPRDAGLADEAERALGAGEVRIRTLFSGISAGTELSFYRGTGPFAEKRWERDLRLFVPNESPPSSVVMPGNAKRGQPGAARYPIDGMGYEEVGRISEVGQEADGVRVGDVVWGTWGHRESVVKTAEYASNRRLGAGVSPIVGVFSQIGAIALNVVLDADIHVGETVAVFGMGVPGQIVAQLARLNGARVIAVDRFARRLEMAKRLGAWDALDATQVDVARHIREVSGGRGADVCLEVSGAYAALQEAIRSVAYSARVVAAGFFQGEGKGLALGEEFHNNRVQVVCSQIFGVAPALTYRWDESRMQQTFMELVSSGTVQVEPLISRTMPVEEACAAFQLLDKKPEDVLEIVLEFSEAVQ
jgi:threonine dehydrogenase-like Zn-dependent dehydrogenase